MATNNKLGGVRIIWVRGAVNFASSSTLTSNDQTLTVTGAQLGDPVILGGAAVPAANGLYTAFVSLADTVTVRFINYSGGTVDPASFIATVGVVQLGKV